MRPSTHVPDEGSPRTTLPDWLIAWAERPGGSAMLSQARTKWEQGARGARVRIGDDLTVEQRGDIGRLLGTNWALSGRPTTFAALNAALTEAAHLTYAPSPLNALRALLEATGGPLRDLPAERRAASEAKASRRETNTRVLMAAGVPEHVARVAIQRRWFGDDARATDTVAQAGQLLAALHSGLSGLLPEVATTLFNDPHALDRTTPLGRGCVRLLAAISGTRSMDATPSEHGHGAHASATPSTEADMVDNIVSAADQALTAVTWRATWADHGVVCDRLSANVLVLNLPLVGDGPAARLSQVRGEPLWLTARALEAGWTPDPQLREVRVCENPAIPEAAADRVGEGAKALVCTYGRPSTAAHTLLSGLHQAGVRLLVSADRDAVGTQIVSDLLSSYPGSAAWLPGSAGVYEEDRLEEILRDLE